MQLFSVACVSLLFLVHQTSAYVVCPTRGKVAAKAVTLGIRIFNAKSMESLFGCFDSMMYNRSGMDAVVDKAKSCGFSTCSANSLGCYAPLLSTNTDVNNCLKGKSNNTAMTLIDKSVEAAKPALKKLFTKIDNKIKKDKEAGLSETKVYDNAYKLVLSALTANFVDNVCMQITKKITKAEYLCALPNLKKVVDVGAKDYKCAKQYQ